MHLSIRLSDDVDAQLAGLLAARGLGPRQKSKLVRALIGEEHERATGVAGDGTPPVDADELHDLLSTEARDGSVAAMRELRMLLAPGRRGDEGARPGDEAPAAPGMPRVDSFDALDEVASARAKRGS